MAIYHFSAKVISRANGSSALASAAYRSAGRLYDERLDRHHDFTAKSGVVHSEVLTPENVPDEFHNREQLWNAVESGEKRRDAQLAREIEFAIPRELDRSQGIELARDFVREEFVSRGMIADLNVHWDIGADGQAKPHAHVMLTMRSVDEAGFGAKVREWNRNELLEHWREAWGTHVNQRLRELGIDARIDHRSFEDQGIDLEPQHKIGPAAARMAGDGLQSERLDDHRQIARENGEKIIANPSIALDAITHGQATFTRRDLAMFAHRHSDGLEQFNGVMAAVEASPELVRLGRDGHGEDRFTSRDMVRIEERLHRSADCLVGREHHQVSEYAQHRALASAEKRGLVLSGEQRRALLHITDGRDLGLVIGYAGTGKSAMLSVAKEAWEHAGFEVRGIALSGIAAENLEAGSGIASRTIASLEHQWAQGREILDRNHVLVIDEVGMVGSRQLERVLSEAERRGAKVVLVGDPEQLQAIEAGAAFRSLSERHPHVEITEIRRQREAWQRDATRHLATGRTVEALDAYRGHDMVHVEPTRDQARSKLVETWDRDRQASPDKSRIILTHTNEEVQSLNQLARERLREAGDLGEDVAVTVERGKRDFAAGDRVMMLKNERSLGIKNGTLATVERVTSSHMDIRLDDGRQVGFDFKDYNQLDHGYAATIHKAQGVTVDRVHVLATPGLDRHASYVALSRHRERVDLHFGRNDFADDGKLARTLSRERAKDMASDYGRDAQAQVREISRDQSRDSSAADQYRHQVTPGQNRTLDAGQQPAEIKRGMFATFRPQMPSPDRGIDQHRAPERAAIPKLPVDAPERAAERDAAIGQYGRARTNIDHMRDRQLPVLPEQERALENARSRLDAVRPKLAADMESAIAHNPSLLSDAAKGQTNRIIRALQAEAEIRTNPALRADRFVAEWQGLSKAHNRLERAYDFDGANAVRANMAGMAKSLERDPQVESILRNRKIELGLGAREGPSVGAELMDHLGRGRNRGLGL
ncbi:Ti-type conjugative transfer relaxase TraA [Rhizomicrobium electricum]|uniref:Ti-type conjugative transfer relaxase TraA n=1 Tax=Rhizomicrobium electricum TaxID=480070 RepID=A0ABN1EUA1_9PROT|nr:Ti-type conjugative transfer relaxase TraA [Rhizomicrobium electricum]NIJ49761.1 Ti-type conjugative transfer relaxase TraA [Rhizomicrobium electricum]